MCMYVCMYVYVYVLICVYVCAYVCMCVCVGSTHLHDCCGACAHEHTHISMHGAALSIPHHMGATKGAGMVLNLEGRGGRVYMCVYTYINMCVYMYICICIYVYTCVCMYVYIYICVSMG
jgi:hypothetical protein